MTCGSPLDFFFAGGFLHLISDHFETLRSSAPAILRDERRYRRPIGIDNKERKNGLNLSVRRNSKVCDVV